MSRKTKINVLLPFKMVGELENFSRLGKRSHFIENAIRSRLDASEDYSPRDIPTEQLWNMLHHRIDNNLVKQLILIIKEMEL